MTIAELRGKCKILLDRIPRDALVLGVILSASSASFGLGYLAGENASGQGSVSIEVTGPAPAASAALPEAAGAYVASKNGSKYYLSTCAAASRISDANKVWFDSAGAASAAGYAPAANCPGL